MTAAEHDTAIPDFVRTITTPTACAKNPNQWQSANESDQEHARRRCSICPFQAACRQWAMERDEVGMWGGLTRHERQRARGERITSQGEYDEAPTRRRCACGRIMPATGDDRFCHLHPNGVPLLTPLLISTLEAALDGAQMVVVGERLGISMHAVVSRLGMAYQRLGVGELPPKQRLVAAVKAARAAGALAEELVAC